MYGALNVFTTMRTAANNTMLNSAGAFKVCEVDLAPVVNPDVHAAFAAEVTQRRQKRDQRASREAAKEKRELMAAELMAAKSAGPSAADLRAMPSLPGGADVALEEASDDVYLEATPGTSPDAPSFARIAALGFAATGPALGGAGSPDVGGLSLADSRFQALPRWGPKVAPESSGSEAAVGTGSGTGQGSSSGGGGGKKKGGKQVLLLSTSQRRY
jgi:hypothetical protein